MGSTRLKVCQGGSLPRQRLLALPCLISTVHLDAGNIYAGWAAGLVSPTWWGFQYLEPGLTEAQVLCVSAQKEFSKVTDTQGRNRLTNIGYL